jgi:ABC-type Mn2+/Zn2+ transport system ATPase subunit
MIEKLRFDHFTAFDTLEINFSKGINVFVGENGTGKTHILKAVYAACHITKSKKSLANKINDVFYPAGKQIGRLVKRTKGSTSGWMEVKRKLSTGQDAIIRLSLTNHNTSPEQAKISGTTKLWMEESFSSVFIPVKDMMANAPGFRSMFAMRNVHFEEEYLDIIDHAFLPSIKGPMDRDRANILEILQKAMEGKVIEKKEEFFLKNKQGVLEFTLLAEGYRKLGLLWLLIQNGSILNGSVLFWDEPETNLNPKLLETVVRILMELQRLGVQIFVTTHDYVLLKEFDLATKTGDSIKYHALYRKKTDNEIAYTVSDKLQNISPNTIDDTFGSLINRQIIKEMGELGK